MTKKRIVPTDENERIMPWINELPGVAATNFPFRRDQITALINVAIEFSQRAEVLRAKAYFAGCALECDARRQWTIEAVEQAKQQAGW